MKWFVYFKGMYENKENNLLLMGKSNYDFLKCIYVLYTQYNCQVMGLFIQLFF